MSVGARVDGLVARDRADQRPAPPAAPDRDGDALRAHTSTLGDATFADTLARRPGRFRASAPPGVLARQVAGRTVEVPVWSGTVETAFGAVTGKLNVEPKTPGRGSALTDWKKLEVEFKKGLKVSVGSEWLKDSGSTETITIAGIAFKGAVELQGLEAKASLRGAPELTVGAIKFQGIGETSAGTFKLELEVAVSPAGAAQLLRRLPKQDQERLKRIRDLSRDAEKHAERVEKLTETWNSSVNEVAAKERQLANLRMRGVRASDARVVALQKEIAFHRTGMRATHVSLLEETKRLDEAGSQIVKTQKGLKTPLARRISGGLVGRGLAFAMKKALFALEFADTVLDGIDVAKAIGRFWRDGIGWWEGGDVDGEGRGQGGKGTGGGKDGLGGHTDDAGKGKQGGSKPTKAVPGATEPSGTSPRPGSTGGDRKQGDGGGATQGAGGGQKDGTDTGAGTGHGTGSGTGPSTPGPGPNPSGAQKPKPAGPARPSGPKRDQPKTPSDRDRDDQGTGGTKPLRHGVVSGIAQPYERKERDIPITGKLPLTRAWIADDKPAEGKRVAFDLHFVIDGRSFKIGRATLDLTRFKGNEATGRAAGWLQALRIGTTRYVLPKPHFIDYAWNDTTPMALPEP